MNNKPKKVDKEAIKTLQEIKDKAVKEKKIVKK